MINPRASFAQFLETVSGCCAEWSEDVMKIASNVQQNIYKVFLPPSLDPGHESRQGSAQPALIRASDGKNMIEQYSDTDDIQPVGNIIAASTSSTRKRNEAG